MKNDELTNQKSDRRAENRDFMESLMYKANLSVQYTN